MTRIRQYFFFPFFDYFLKTNSFFFFFYFIFIKKIYFIIISLCSVLPLLYEWSFFLIPPFELKYIWSFLTWVLFRLHHRRNYRVTYLTNNEQYEDQLSRRPSVSCIPRSWHHRFSFICTWKMWDHFIIKWMHSGFRRIWQEKRLFQL